MALDRIDDAQTDALSSLIRPFLRHLSISSRSRLRTKHHKYPCNQNPIFCPFYGAWQVYVYDFPLDFLAFSFPHTFITNAISFDSLEHFSLLLTLRMPYHIQ